MLKKINLQFCLPDFYKHCKADAKLWCYFVLFQQICRAYFIVSLSHYLVPSTKLITILYAMIYGVRFDSLWAICWIFITLVWFTIPSLLACSISSEFELQCRRYIAGVFTFVTTLIYLISIEYYREYKDLFNHFMFNWLYDDKVAILKTIYAEHHVIFNIILLFCVVFLYIICSGYFIRRRPFLAIKIPNFFSTKTKNRLAYKTLSLVPVLLFYVVGFRGGFGPRPIQLKDAGVTNDVFLNNAIVSPYSALKYAFKVRRMFTKLNYENTNLSGSEVQTIAKRFFNTPQQYKSLEDYMKRVAKGSMLPRPKHIVLVVGESLDTWPLEPEYREFNLTPNLLKIIADGIYFKYFLASSYGTIGTLNTIMTGIPDADMLINYRDSARFPYATTLATQLKKLGFKPQFFYGGYLSWQYLGEFARAQGFDDIYGAPNIIDNWLSTNEWGVDDRLLFDFVIKTIQTSKTPTFNLIMTTSNHPPFSINLKREGFHTKEVAKLLSKYAKKSTNVKQLGHIWYTDKTIAEFVEKMLAMDKSTLFIITGDHYGRRHILPHPPPFDASAVPLIIYNAKIKNYYSNKTRIAANLTAGSHLDLDATLIELVAPKGFTYYAMGDNLLAKRQFNWGMGSDKIITPDFIASSDATSVTHFKEKESTKNLQNNIKDNQVNILKERFDQAIHIIRYIVIKGANFYESKQIQ